MLELNIKEVDNKLEFSVSDNGKGFDEITVRRGNGLNNMQKRADELGAKATTDFKLITMKADIYIIAVSDASIKDVAETISLPGKIVVHTSGAVSLNVLHTVSDSYGVLYPLQSLRKEIEYIPTVPLFIDGNSPAVLETVREFGKSISKYVAFADDAKRLKLHLCGVIVSNFTNHLYALTADYCKKEGANFSMLVPLIQEVANRTKKYAPENMQTGPAVRGDIETIEKHLELLNYYPQLQNIYTQVTESIKQFHRQE